MKGLVIPVPKEQSNYELIGNLIYCVSGLATIKSEPFTQAEMVKMMREYEKEKYDLINEIMDRMKESRK